MDEWMSGPLRLHFFDRHVLLRFHSSVISSDAGPLAYGEWDDATSLTSMAGEELADARLCCFWAQPHLSRRQQARIRTILG
jgi:hypothetical protein